MDQGGSYNHTIDRPLVWALIVLAVGVHATGLFDPIFSGDSAVYAVIAKSFVTSGDWMNIYVDGMDWLDKPHFPFWLEAASMQVFGISAFAYKLPALLLFLVGLIYTYRLAKDLYDENVALVSVLMLATSLHLFISNNDVRAEAMLIGLIMGGVYHFYCSAKGGSVWHIVIGSAFCAAAVMTKGPFVVIVFISPIAAFLIHKKRLTDLLSWRWVLAALLVAIFILPEMIALYRQFDMHPEKVILGETNVSGLRYFFWETQFGRFFNNGPFRGNGSPVFFVHSLLWAFAPWAVLGYAALAVWVSDAARRRYVTETLSFGGFAVMFVIFSASRFQLPYYTNIVFPVLSILTAAFVLTRLGESGIGTLLLRISLGASLIFVTAMVAAMEYMFEAGFLPPLISTSVVVLVIFVILLKRARDLNMTLLYTSAAVMSLFAVYCNTAFYPRLLTYQAGYEAAKIINAEFSGKRVATSEKDNLLKFYLLADPQRISTAGEARGLDTNFLLFVDKQFKDQLDADGVRYDTIRELPDFRVTRLTPAFLDPARRGTVVETKYLLLLR